jgi:hypothetical protein
MISCSGVCESGSRKCVRNRKALFGLFEADEDCAGASLMYEVAFCRRELNMAGTAERS